MKKHLLLIGLSLTVISSGFAATSPFPKFLLNKIHKSNVQKTMSSHEGYANFSGHWVGTCDNNPEEQQTTVIEQSLDSSSVVIDDMTIPIDGITSNGFTGNFETENSLIHYRWNEDGQKILGTALFYNKAGNMSQGDLQITVVKFDYAIENQQLVTSYALSTFIDGALAGNNSYRCVYDKSGLNIS